jgi:hypothetical protein
MQDLKDVRTGNVDLASLFAVEEDRAWESLLHAIASVQTRLFADTGTVA